MTYIHFPTLLLHIALTIFGAVTINQYHDAFLLVAVLVLLAHAIWYARSKHNMFPAHIFGCITQFFLYHLDVIDVHSGAFGLGGGEFALFFYEIAMFLSCIIELIIWLTKLHPRRAS